MLGEVRLLLVEVDRVQLEGYRRLLLQLQQDVQHRVAVLAAGQADHDPVAGLDHAVVGDGLADLAAQALGELVVLVGGLARDGIGQGQVHRTAGGGRRDGAGILLPPAAVAGVSSLSGRSACPARKTRPKSLPSSPSSGSNTATSTRPSSGCRPTAASTNWRSSG